MRLLFTSLLISAFSSVNAQLPLATYNSSSVDSVQSACMQNASRLLDEAFVLMQKNYYRKDYVNWDTLKMSARQKLFSSQNCEDAYETINWSFQQIKEKHSFIMSTQKALEYASDKELKTAPSLHQQMGVVRYEMMGDSIGYISIPWVSTTDEAVCTLIADSIQGCIARLDEKGLRKWIVDLRNNKGGNCWPMIAGAGPLIGEGVCGYFVRNEERVPIAYAGGKAMQGKTVRCTASQPYHLKQKELRIAVLINNGTSSSGEIVALAFKGRKDVSFFGECTAGYTTANATYTLSDKSMLVLTGCKEADRTGRVHHGRIYPDIPQLSTSNADHPKAAAFQWLSGQ